MLARARTGWLLAALLVATACDSSSPTEPTPVAAASTIVFQDAGALSDHQGTITTLLEDTLAQARPVLHVDPVTITVFADASRAIPGWGIGGYTTSPTTVEIIVDPAYSGLAQVLPQRLPHIAAHEFHHAVRGRGPGYGFTLFENMISEGLADHFGIELLGGPLPPWSDAFGEDQTQRYLDRARPEFDSMTFDFNAWFFGIGTDLPRWTGYTLGYRLVDDYQRRNPGRSAAQLVNTPADDFRPPS